MRKGIYQFSPPSQYASKYLGAFSENTIWKNNFIDEIKFKWDILSLSKDEEYAKGVNKYFPSTKSIRAISFLSTVFYQQFYKCQSFPIYSRTHEHYHHGGGNRWGEANEKGEREKCESIGGESIIVSRYEQTHTVLETGNFCCAMHTRHKRICTRENFQYAFRHTHRINASKAFSNGTKIHNPLKLLAANIEMSCISKAIGVIWNLGCFWGTWICSAEQPKGNIVKHVPFWVTRSNFAKCCRPWSLTTLVTYFAYTASS